MNQQRSQTVARILIVLALSYIGFSVPVYADYCTDQCLPTCYFWIDNCEGQGGTITGLCSCGLDQNGNYSQCMFPSCTLHGDPGGGDCDYGCDYSLCPQFCN